MMGKCAGSFVQSKCEAVLVLARQCFAAKVAEINKIFSTVYEKNVKFVVSTCSHAVIRGADISLLCFVIFSLTYVQSSSIAIDLLKHPQCMPNPGYVSGLCTWSCPDVI